MMAGLRNNLLTVPSKNANLSMQSLADRGLFPAVRAVEGGPLREAWLPLALGGVCTGATVLLWRALAEERTASGMHSPFPESVLISGLLVAWLLALSVWLLRLARARTRSAQAARVEL
jgi:hypothetical protein